MLIFADHCIHTDVVIALRRSGFKVERASEVGLEKSSDKKIFNYVLKTSQVLLTFDKDFGNIIRFDINNSAGVIIVYIERMAKDVIIRKIIDFLKSKKKDLKGKLFIIDYDEIRIWPR